MAVAPYVKPTLEEIRSVLAGESEPRKRTCDHISKMAVVCGREIAYRSKSGRCNYHQNSKGWLPCARAATCGGYGMASAGSSSGMCSRCSVVARQTAYKARVKESARERLERLETMRPGGADVGSAAPPSLTDDG